MVKYMSSFDHLAGTEGDYQIAQYVSGKLKEAGMRDIRSEEYVNNPPKTKHFKDGLGIGGRLDL